MAVEAVVRTGKTHFCGWVQEDQGRVALEALGTCQVAGLTVSQVVVTKTAVFGVGVVEIQLASGAGRARSGTDIAGDTGEVTRHAEVLSGVEEVTRFALDASGAISALRTLKKRT